MNYTGITVTENNNSAVAINAIKIANGVHDIFTIAADDTMTVGATDPIKLITVTVDTTNHVFSGYDVDGNKYIIDKAATISIALV